MADQSSPITNPAQQSPSSVLLAVAGWIADLGGIVEDWIIGLGNMSIFSLRTLGWLFSRLPRKETIWPNFYQIGVLSLPVVALTGTFIGMVLVVQSYVQFRNLHLEAKLGAVINMSLVRELGPVLAATMLAGRVGSAMAAELGTMRVTEQIDALATMGANPIYYLVVPRFLGCLMLIPALTIMADFMGVAGAFFYAVNLLGIDGHHYLENSQHFVGDFRPFRRYFQEPVLRRCYCANCLLSRLPLRPGGRGRRPGRYRRLRLFVRDDPLVGPVVGHRPGWNLLFPMARSTKIVLGDIAYGSLAGGLARRVPRLSARGGQARRLNDRTIDKWSLPQRTLPIPNSP